MRSFRVHKFLRAIGFSNIRKKDLEYIIEEIIEHPEVMRVTIEALEKQIPKPIRRIQRYWGDGKPSWKDYYCPVCSKQRRQGQDQAQDQQRGTQPR